MIIAPVHVSSPSSPPLPARAPPQHELHHVPQPLHAARPAVELAHDGRQRHDVVRADQRAVAPEDGRLDLEHLGLEGAQVRSLDGRRDGAADGRRVRGADLGRRAAQLGVQVAQVRDGAEELALGRGECTGGAAAVLLEACIGLCGGGGAQQGEGWPERERRISWSIAGTGACRQVVSKRCSGPGKDASMHVGS